MAAVIAAVLTLLAAPVTEAIGVAPAESLSTCAYDGHHHPAPVTGVVTERRPPVAHHLLTTYDAVDRWSHGNWSCSDATTTRAATTYDDPAGLVQHARVAGTASRHAEALDGVLLALDRWHVAAKGASGLSDDLARLANQHVTGSSDTVLGRYPGYIKKANSKGASYFDIGDDWNKMVARGQDPWALNQHFLDGRIAAGDRILLSVPKGDIVPGTYLAREVQYLTSNGYRWTNQWSLRPGG